MAERDSLTDRQHAEEFLKILDSWLPLRLPERTRLQVQVRVELNGKAAAILKGLEAHGRGAARFVASQTGSSDSSIVLWWVNGQLSDDFSRDDETARAFHRVRHIVDNALLQVEGGAKSGAMEDATREYLMKVGTLKGMLNQRARGQQPSEGDYAALRSELVSIRAIWDRLPTFVLTYPTLQEFWIFIKPTFATYNERTEFLRQEFAPILSWLEGGVEGGDAVSGARATRRSEARRSGSMIKVLLLSANPLDAPLSIDEEFRAIDAKIRASDHRDSVDLIKHGAVRLEDIPSLLMRHKPHVVHFSGHGDKVAIELTTSDGRGHLVPPNALADIFRVLKDNVRVVLLNACDSAPQAEAIVSVIDCAVGMSDEIEDEAAIAFAAAFYEALGYGRSVQDAVDLALVQLTGAGADRSLAKLHKRRGVKPSDIVLVTPQRPQ
jgi:hypothetical protein